MQNRIASEIQRRRSFAIISHPDAGKTTMTEKLLLYGGAIRLAGTVKGRKAAKHATSDWMEIEKQRGISVSSSVLQFEYEGACVNILDTPGHQDFSEDTYRTLCAADAAVMMIDGAKGIEEQTLKLFHVCRLRHIPIFTFVNKMDRAARNPFDLMDELEKVLGVFAVPFNWPIGTDGDFQGLYNRRSKEVELFNERKGDHGASLLHSNNFALGAPELHRALPDYYFSKLSEEIELLDLAGDELDLEKFIQGGQTPMFFGSALNNYGIDFFLREFLRLAPAPGARESDQGLIDPLKTDFSAFVFKIQANMNKDHHDRLAFIRINSGRFVKDMDVVLTRTGKKLKLAQPTQFMASERSQVEEAFAGDIIGLFDPGIYHLGDTLSAGKRFNFKGIPVFPPEHFARIQAKDSLKRKQFQKGIAQLAQEGAIQVYKEASIGTETYVVGVVGELQFEVLEFRLRSEYQVEIRRQNLPYRLARWLEGRDELPVPPPSELIIPSSSLLVYDLSDKPVLLFESPWALDFVRARNPELYFRSINGED